MRVLYNVVPEIGKVGETIRIDNDIDFELECEMLLGGYVM